MLRAISLCVLSICCFSNLFAQNLRTINPPATRKVEQIGAQQFHYHQQRLDLYRFYNVVDEMLSIQDVQAKILGTAHLADLLWKYDEGPARLLFEKALSLTDAGANRERRKLLNPLRQSVLALLAKRDGAWSKRLIDASVAAVEDDDLSSLSEWSEANVAIASTLVADNPDAASDFASRSLQRGVSPSLVWFLKDFRRSHAREADQLFLQALARCSQQPPPDINDFALLGTYIFTSPKAVSGDPTNIIFTRVGDVGIVDITGDQPTASPLLIRAFLAAAIEVLSRQIPNAYQRQAGYALGYLLLPKARLHAPDLLPRLAATMSSFSSSVPLSITEESAYANIKKTRPDNAELIANAEKVADSQSRDMAFLDIAFHAWLEKDFATARRAADKLDAQEPKRALAALIDFGEGAALINQPARLPEAERLANKLPQGVERAILHLALARSADKSGDVSRSLDATARALQAAHSVNDVRKPFLIMMAASQLAETDPVAAQSALTDAIKEFNKHEESAIRSVSWQQKVEVGSLVERFPLNVSGLEFGFGPPFRSLVSNNLDEAVSTASGLASESLRARAFVEIGRAVLQSVPASEQAKEPLVRVGEDGMRMSAVKTVMPGYPEEARKQGHQGVAVVEVEYNGKGNVTGADIVEAPAPAIGDAVIEAVRQWKFKPSTLKGEPISVRGKLTFYFVIAKDGTFRVENPKQFQ